MPCLPSPTTDRATRATTGRRAVVSSTCATAGSRPYRPQTNGKVERFNRTLVDEWAYVRPYRSEAERLRRLERWLHDYNHHRGHTALAGRTPIEAVNNGASYYT